VRWTEGQTAYEVVDRITHYWDGDSDTPTGSVVTVSVVEWRIVRVTPCGAWVECAGPVRWARWASHHSRRFAPSVAGAYDLAVRRRRTHARFAEQRAAEARRRLDRLERDAAAFGLATRAGGGE